MFYRYVLKPYLFRLDPEWVHERFIALGEILGWSRAGRGLMRLIYGYHGPDISRTVDGIKYRTPVLLAAGFDYNGRLTQVLPALGFGGVEVGSVTARPCAGNPSPRLKRRPEELSLVVNKGLRNDGVDVVIKRIQSRPKEKGFVIGVSIARTNNQAAAGVEEGIKDYLYSLRQLLAAGVGDYYTLNISCPNAFAGEEFLVPAALTKLLAAVDALNCPKPLYVKMPIHLPVEQFKELLAVINNSTMNGLIIGNLDKSRPAIGNCSGVPCRERSTNLIKLARDLYGRRFTIFGVGGVFSPPDATDKLAAGANLIQLITGMIYEGPSLIKRIDRAIL